MIRAAILFLLTLRPLAAQSDPAWKNLAFLTGKWLGVAGEKDTPLGDGKGSFSFIPDLNGKILVRRNEARYQSGASHDDLMVIYLENGPRAIYFDTEGHTIHYTLSFPAPNTAVFDAPQYRLTYWMDQTILKGKFEVGGKQYMAWSAKRQ